MFVDKEKLWVLLISVCITSLLLGGAGVAGFVWIRSEGNGSATSDEKGGEPARRTNPALVRVETASWDEIGTIRTVVGRFVQIRSGTVSSEVSGIVQELPVEVGTKTLGGKTIIARIDDTWTKLALEQAENQINVINVQLDFEKIELRRIIPLAQNFTISESDYLTQRAKVDDLQASLELARVAKREAEEKLARTLILAPFDGYIVKKSTEVGDLLAPGTPIVETISSGGIDAVINVDESIVHRLQLEDEITIYVDHLRQKAVGKVHAIVPYAPTGARKFPVYVRLDDQNGRFKVGMSITALIQTEEKQPGICIPRDAIIDKPDGQTVWVVQEVRAGDEAGGTRTIAQPVPVKIRATAIDIFSVEPETLEGKEILVPGAKVVIEGGERLMPNQVVQIVPSNAEWFEGLPTGSGHTIISPKSRLSEISEAIPAMSDSEGVPEHVPLEDMRGRLSE